MEYAITASIVALFVIVYVFTRPKLKEAHHQSFDEASFLFNAKVFVQNMPLPSKGGQNKSKRYVFEIKKGMLLLKTSKFKRIFADFLQFEDKINLLCKQNFTPLDDLPSISGEARIVSLARYCLCHSKYIFCDDRVSTLISEQNKWRTLTIDEILQFERAFCYVLLEKLAFLIGDLTVIIKMHRLATKYVSSQFQNDGLLPHLKNELFLSICAKRAGYESEHFDKIYSNTLISRVDILNTIFSSLDSAELYDFSRFYTPLEIFDKFDAFSYAPTICKQSFLKLVSKLSNNENIDEFMFAVRIEKYITSASDNHIKVVRGSAFSKRIAILSKNQDISLLCAALCSSYFMNMFFGENKVNYCAKSSKSILKISKLQNTFVPIYKFQSVNFGISTLGDKLKISPRLPKQIDFASLTFDNKGTKHTLSIERGSEKQLFLNGIKLTGVEEITLTNNPLDIKITIID